jgi:hypothetical protein
LEESELSTTEDELKELLEGERKPLKNIVLPQNSNDIDQGSDNSNAKEKIGQKNLEAQFDKQRFARMDYLTERDTKIKFGDKQAIAEYMAEVEERRQRLEEQKFRDREEYDYRQAEKKRLAIEAKITPEDKENERLDIEKLQRKRDKEIADIQDYFNSSDEFWQEYQHNGHESYESPAAALITQTNNGTWACDIHRYQPVLESPINDGRLLASSFTIDKVEDHFRKDPKPHLEALTQIINEKYSKLIEARKQKTLEDKDVAFKREIRQIESIPTRPDGDAGLLSSAKKITKGERARIRREEEAQAEENKRIYRGLY